MTQFQQSRKQRQLSLLISKLKHLLESGRDLSSDSFRVLVMRIRALVFELQALISANQIRKIIGSCAVVLGISFATHLEGQSFATPVENPFGLIKAGSAYVYLPSFADIDGDGDADLFVGGIDYGSYVYSIYYYENTGSTNAPDFAAPKINPFQIQLDPNVFPNCKFSDLDGDGDLDIMMFGYSYDYETNFVYYENTGTVNSPSFATALNNPFGLDQYVSEEFVFPTFGDIDDDGDLDLIGNTYDKFVFFENNGDAMSPDFNAVEINPFGIMGDSTMTTSNLVDIDMDGDLDIFAGTYENGSHLFFENAGTKEEASFASVKINPFGLVSTYYLSVQTFADLDGDGDMDMLVQDYDGNFQYFENTTVISSVENPKADVVLLVTPNPANDIISIQTDQTIQLIELLDINGNVIHTYNDAFNSLDISNLDKGAYFIRVRSLTGQSTIKKFMKI